MGRRIVVVSNCQLGAVATALAAMLPDDEVVPRPWTGTLPEGLEADLAEADAWVSCLPRAESEAVIAGLDAPLPLITIPLLSFFGYHPDCLHLTHPDGGEVQSAVGPYCSSIVTWGWAHGMGVDDVVARFTPAVMEGLGHTTAWAGAMGRMRTIVGRSDLDLARLHLPLVRGGCFMLTDNHPRVRALVQVARLVAEQLGADPDRVAVPWEDVIPDGLLATAAVWPVYPPVAESLGLVGSYVWRTPDGELIGLREFVGRTLELLAPIDPAQVDLGPVATDPRFERTLGPPVAAPAGAGV